MDAKVMRVRSLHSRWLREEYARVVADLEIVASSLFYNWDVKDPLVRIKIRKSAYAILRSMPRREHLFDLVLNTHGFLRAVHATKYALRGLDAEDTEARHFPMRAEDYLQLWPAWLANTKNDHPAEHFGH